MNNRREYQLSMLKLVSVLVILHSLAFTPLLKAQITYIDAKDFIVGDSIPVDSVFPRSPSNQTYGLYFDVDKGSLHIGQNNSRKELANLSFSMGNNRATGIGSFTTGDLNLASGFNSIALGYDNEASGNESFAMGFASDATANNSLAFGYFAKASGQYSSAIGNAVEASSFNSFVIGKNNVKSYHFSTNEWKLAEPLFVVGNGEEVANNALTLLKGGTFILNNHELPTSGSALTRSLHFFDIQTASFRTGSVESSDAFGHLGLNSFATGKNTISSGINSAAFGFNTQSLGGSTTTFGSNTSASNDNATAFGESSTAIGRHGFAIGEGSQADSRTSFVIGQYNIGGGNPEDWTGTDPLFEIGNGISNAQRANALLMRKDGRTIIGKRNFALQDRLTVNSEAGEPSFRVQVNNQTKLRVHGNGSVTLGLNNTNVSSNDVYIANDLGIGIDSAEARLDVNGNSLMRGSANITGDAIVNGNSLIAGNSLVSGFSLVTGNSIVEMNSGGANGPQLELHETSTSDFARLMFTNENPETYWTIAARPESDVFSSKFNVFLQTVGNVLTLNGEKYLGVGRDPDYPIHVGTNSSNGNGAHVTAGGTWTNGSSRTFKENFQPINTSEILSILSGLEIQKWEYRGTDEGVHIGPLAEEFYEAFGLGNNEKYISTVDIDGVALAAIQALAKENEELKQRLEKLERIIAEIEAR